MEGAARNDWRSVVTCDLRLATYDLPMIPTYASFRQKLPASAFTLTTIAGTTTVAEIYNVYLQLENRSGVNLLSDVQSIELNPGEGLRVTINSSAIASGEDVFWVVVSLETTGNSQDAARVATWKAKDDNQITPRNLPATIDLTTDEHFAVTRVAATFNDLPATGFLDGAIAFVVDTGNYYRYDSEAYSDGDNYISYGTIVEGANNWIRYFSTNLSFIADTRDTGGSDRRLADVTSSLNIPAKATDADSTPLKIWLNNGYENDGNSPIINGNFSLRIAIDGISGYENNFADKIKYYLRGYVDRSAGELNTAIAEVNQEKLWNPINGTIKLSEDLPRNQAAVYDLILSFNQDDLAGVLPSNNPLIAIDVVSVGNNQGIASEVTSLIGDLVFSDRDQLLIVPGELRLAGLASIKLASGEKGYFINATTEQPIAGLLPDTSDQIAAMAGSLNGLITIRQQGDSLEHGEVVRAIISTESGISNLSVASEAIALNNAGITVTVSHPIDNDDMATIRSSYPDSLLAGLTKGSFTPTQGYLFLALNGIIYQSELISVTAISSQDIQVSNLDNFTLLATLPVQSDPAFSLFEPTAIAISANITGTISGNVTAYFAYYYDQNNTKATKIRHDLTGVIPTSTLTLGEIASNLSAVVDHLTDFDNPHQITTEQIGAAKQTDLDATNTNVSTNTMAISTNVTNITTNTGAIALNTTARENLGTAANKNFGTATGELVELQDVNGTPGLPAVDGSQLTGIDALFEIVFISGDFTAEATTPAKNYLIDTSTAVSNITLPTVSADISRIAFSDRAQSFGTNNGIITPATGDTVNGNPNFALDFDGESVTLVYDAVNTNWIVINGIQSTSTGSGDMLKSVYDPGNNGVVDKASAVDGIDTAGSLKFYGTDAAGVAGFYDYLVATAVRDALQALTDTNRLSGSAIGNFKAIANAPADGYAPIYDLNSDTIQWQFVNRGVGAGAILIPSSQSLFETADGALSTYTPDVGSAVFEDLKIISSAGVVDNQIISEQLQINTPETGVALDLGISDTVIRTDWTFNTGDVGAIILRYNSDGNMNLLEMSGTAIAFKSIVADVETTVLTTGYTFTNGTNYKIEVQCLGVTFKVLINDTVAIAEVLSNEFLTATKFGLGRR